MKIAGYKVYLHCISIVTHSLYKKEGKILKNMTSFHQVFLNIFSSQIANHDWFHYKILFWKTSKILPITLQNANCLYVMFVSYDWLTTCYVKKTSKRKKKRWRFDQFQYQINKYLMHYHGSKSQKNCCRHWENLQLYSLRNILSQMVLILVHKKLIWHIHIILINEKWQKLKVLISITS